MQQKTRLKYIYWIKSALCLIMLLFIAEGSVYSYFYVFEPAYVSVVDACNIKTDEEIESMEYTDGGYYFPKSDKIEIVVPSKYEKLMEDYKKTKEYQRSLKHELCHRNQQENNRLNNNCNQLIRFWIDESECYIKQYF